MEYKIEYKTTDDIESILNLNERKPTIQFPEFYGTVYDGSLLIGVMLIFEIRPGCFAFPYRYIKEEYRKNRIGEELYRFCCIELMKLPRFESISFKSTVKRSGWVDRRLKEGFKIVSSSDDYNVFFGEEEMLRRRFK